MTLALISLLLISCTMAAVPCFSLQTNQLQPLDLEKYYHGCWNWTGCLPESCVEERNCHPYFMNYRQLPSPSEYMQMVLIAQRITGNGTESPCDPASPSSRYIALGLSLEQRKTNIAVVECSMSPVDPNSTRILMAWTGSNHYIRYHQLNCVGSSFPAGVVRNCDVQIDLNDNLVCKFEIKKRFVSTQQVYDVDADEDFVLYLTSGCNVSDLDRGFQKGGKQYSTGLVHLHRVRQTTVLKTSFRVRGHACLMMFTWCVCVPSAIFFSRYLKESFVDYSFCGYRLWFAGHTTLMSIAYASSLLALLFILQQHALREFAWPTKPSGLLHLRIGAAAMLMLSLQVFSGWVRFSGRKSSRGFAFFHLLNGLSCLTLAYVNVGMAYYKGMPCRIAYYTVGWVVWMIICHLMMMIHFYSLDKRLGLYYSRAMYPFPIPPVTLEDLPGMVTRLRIVIVHVIGSLTLYAVTLIDFFVNKKGCPCTSDFCRDTTSRGK